MSQRKTIKLALTYDKYRDEIAEADFSNQTELQFVRRLVAQMFLNKGYVVVNPAEIKYHYLEKYIMIEGTVGVALLSK